MRSASIKKIKNIIFFPSMLGQTKKGVESGPSVIVREIIKKEKKTDFKKTNKYWVDVKNSKCIYDNLENLYETNENVKGPRINIGGDHSMSIATVAHSLNNYDNLKLIWIDAHGDINTSYSSPTNNLHGMPLGYLTNLDTNDNFYFIFYHLNLKDILYIGIRDLDSFEKEVVKKNTSIIDTKKFNRESYIDEIEKFIGDDPIHISFDVDSLDPIYFPSTGTLVKNGLYLNRVKELFDYLHEKKFKQIKNIDITEFNPKIGSKEDVKRSIDSIMYIFDKYI